jgi:hypothetical protein
MVERKKMAGVKVDEDHWLKKWLRKKLCLVIQGTVAPD